MSESKKAAFENGEAPVTGTESAPLPLDDRAEDQDGSLKVHGDKLEKLIPKGHDHEAGEGGAPDRG
jgi:hypothetical protein